VSKEWKPGDVGEWMYMSAAPQIALRVVGCNFLEHDRRPHWHLSGGGWTGYDGNVRPLVVIDPEDREQVQRLEAEMSRGMGWRRLDDGPRVDALQAALREIATPTPPKPEEPKGLGAVVEDGEGYYWVRAVHENRSRWWLALCGWRDYADIDAVRIISDGVTS
jgi:hypothetical protein